MSPYTLHFDDLVLSTTISKVLYSRQGDAVALCRTSVIRWSLFHTPDRFTVAEVPIGPGEIGGREVDGRVGSEVQPVELPQPDDTSVPSPAFGSASRSLISRRAGEEAQPFGFEQPTSPVLMFYEGDLSKADTTRGSVIDAADQCVFAEGSVASRVHLYDVSGAFVARSVV